MRGVFTGTLFVLAVLVAACGGGGGGGAKSGLLPAAGTTPGNNTPAKTKTTQATIALYVPPPNKQNARSKPLYVPSNTQSFGVYVEAYPSTLPSIGPSSTPPPGIVFIPVATPSPCAAASAGGYTCTLTVTAPVGTDLFVVAAFAQPSPNPSQAPLSAFLSGPVTVSLSPSPGASPLAFTLNGIVNSVAVAVNSPDPGNTPNTQTFTVGLPTNAPVAITAFDSSGNQVLSPATSPFYNPISVQASPAAEGLTLSLISTSACGSSASGATATINCVGDLGNVQVTYDGTPRPDASDHLIDAFAVYSSTAPNPTPSPANFVLTSNIESWTVAADSQPNAGYLQLLPSGSLLYIASLGVGTYPWAIGTFDPSTSTFGAQNFLTSANSPNTFALASNGNLWVTDEGPIDCYTSTAGGAAPLTDIYPVTAASDGDTIYPTAITIDAAGNLWYAGYDESNESEYVGYWSLGSSSCGTPPSPLVAQFELNGDSYDDWPRIAAMPTGSSVAVLPESTESNPNQVYIISTASAPGSITGVSPLDGQYGAGLAIDRAGTTYAAYTTAYNDSADIEMLPNGSSTISVLTELPPNPAMTPYPNPTGLAAFSPTGGAADRLMYPDENYEALGLVESVPSSPMPIVVSLPNGAYVMQAAYNSKGGEFVLDEDTSNNLNLLRILPTRTWWVPNVTLYGTCYSTALLTVLERGDSGPFTVTGVSATPLPGADHDFLISSSSDSSFTATVTDAHGRSEQFNVTATARACGVAHRRSVTHKH
jgi:hypothetical protein